MHLLGLLTEFDEALSPLRSELILSGWKIFPPAVSFCIYHSNLCPLKSAACLLEGRSFLTRKAIKCGRRADLLQLLFTGKHVDVLALPELLKGSFGLSNQATY